MIIGVAPPAGAAVGPRAKQEEEDEPYGLLDEYMDDILGIPAGQRPANWQRPTLSDTAASMPQIIFADGRKAPMDGELPRKENVAEWDLDGEAAPSAPGPGSSPPPYISGLLKNWAAVDQEGEGHEGQGPDGEPGRPASAQLARDDDGPREVVRSSPAPKRKVAAR